MPELTSAEWKKAQKLHPDLEDKDVEKALVALEAAAKKNDEAGQAKALKSLVEALTDYANRPKLDRKLETFLQGWKKEAMTQRKAMEVRLKAGEKEEEEEEDEAKLLEKLRKSLLKAKEGQPYYFALCLGENHNLAMSKKEELIPKLKMTVKKLTDRPRKYCNGVVTYEGGAYVFAVDGKPERLFLKPLKGIIKRATAVDARVKVKEQGQDDALEDDQEGGEPEERVSVDGARGHSDSDAGARGRSQREREEAQAEEQEGEEGERPEGAIDARIRERQAAQAAALDQVAGWAGAPESIPGNVRVDAEQQRLTEGLTQDAQRVLTTVNGAPHYEGKAVWKSRMGTQDFVKVITRPVDAFLRQVMPTLSQGIPLDPDQAAEWTRLRAVIDAERLDHGQKMAELNPRKDPHQYTFQKAKHDICHNLLVEIDGLIARAGRREQDLQAALLAQLEEDGTLDTLTRLMADQDLDAAGRAGILSMLGKLKANGQKVVLPRLLQKLLTQVTPEDTSVLPWLKEGLKRTEPFKLDDKETPEGRALLAGRLAGTLQGTLGQEYVRRSAQRKADIEAGLEWRVERSEVRELEATQLLAQGVGAIYVPAGGSSEVYVLKQGPNAQFAFKTIEGESAQSGLAKGGGAIREVVCSVVSELIRQQTGLDLGLPEATLASLGGVSGALIEGLRGDPPTGKDCATLEEASDDKARLVQELAAVPAADVQKCLMASLLSGQFDIKWDNVMVEGGHARPFDSGAAYPPREHMERLLKPFKGRVPALGRGLTVLPKYMDELPCAGQELDGALVDALLQVNPDEVAQAVRDARARLCQESGNQLTPDLLPDDQIEIGRLSSLAIQDVLQANRHILYRDFPVAYTAAFVARLQNSPAAGLQDLVPVGAQIF